MMHDGVTSPLKSTPDAERDAHAPAAASLDGQEAAGLSQAPVAAFDDIIRELKALPYYAHGTQVAAGATAADASMDAAGQDADTCVYGEHEGRGIILKSNCFAELGGGAQGACALTLTTADESLVEDGRIIVYGPDIEQLEEGCVAPFAQVVFAGGAKLVGSCHQGIEECQTVRDWVRGCQVRSTPGEVFVRISHQALRDGLTFAGYGRALMELYRQTNDRVKAVEVLFITKSPEDVKSLYPLRERWKSASHDLRRDTWANLGVDIDCPSGGHCGNCKDKATCDQVRRIQSLRRRERDLAPQA